MSRDEMPVRPAGRPPSGMYLSATLSQDGHPHRWPSVFSFNTPLLPPIGTTDVVQARSPPPHEFHPG